MKIRNNLTSRLVLILAALAMLIPTSGFSLPLTLIRITPVDPDGTSGAVDGVEFSKDGVYYAASDNHGVSRIYLTATGAIVGKVTHEYNGGTCAKSEAEINGIAFSPDGQYLATGDGGDGGAKVWRTDSYFDPADPSQEDTAFNTLISNTEVDGLDWSPDGNFIAIASNANIKVYDAQNNFNLVITISPEAGQGAVNSLDFSSDSKYLIYADGGGANASVFVYRTSDWTKMDKFWPQLVSWAGEWHPDPREKAVRQPE